ncbi:unnamed protein product [Cuscuta epithymum]|uniref:SBP-type domain-containing protein n=1 Tax=Cuscuta epithymum TaxID=186058 RepID=A0AAV0E316_9ASTE|nr:unnamed protein product [Cuscuta epithymum]
MDSISFGFEERGFMFSESGFELLPNDTTFTRSTKAFYQMGENVNGHNHHHHETNEVEEFMDFGLGDMLQKSPPLRSVCDDPCLFRVSSGEEIDNNNNNNNNDNGDEILLSTLPGTIIIPDPNHPTVSDDIDAWRLQVPFGLVSDHQDQTPLFPVSGYESDHTAPIFQVGHDCDKGFLLGDNNNFKKVKSLHQRSKDSSSMEAATDEETSVVVKKPRISTSYTNSQQQTSIGIVCQVHGCFRDLSSSKEYHKRHRVCDEHSKTAKVIVDGIEQRFCQQCSRFHLLPEFDDDKRSCRKSLAGHNERRRKPQYESPHAMTGQRFFGMNAQSTPYFLPELLPVNYFGQENYELESNGKPMKKSEEKHISFSTLELPQSAGHLFAKNLPNLHASLPGISHHVSFLRDFTNNHSGASTLKSLTGDGLLPGVIEMEGSYCHAFDNSLGIYYETETDESFQSTESGKTIDLQQLSTHLQRVEQQRKLCSSEAAREMEFRDLET